MRAGESVDSLGTLCRLFGYTRQAYYQQKLRQERAAMRSEFLLGKWQSTGHFRSAWGGRKLYMLTTEFRSEHGITWGRDAFFRLMRDEGLLVRKRKSRKPVTTQSCKWMSGIRIWQRTSNP